MRTRKEVSIISVTLAAFVFGSVLMPAIYAAPPAPRALPKFRVRLVDGRVVSDAILRGSVTVIDFWGTWCRPCLMEIPEYNEFYRIYKGKRLRFIALAVESGTAKDVAEAARRLNIAYPVGAISDQEFDQYFSDLYAFPTTWVVDAKGNIQKEFLGVTPNKQKALREIVDRLLNGPSPKN